jgi:hypothetical protein
LLANEAVVDELRSRTAPSLDVESFLTGLERLVKRHWVLCTADPRLVLEGAHVRLSARELTNELQIEQDVTGLEKYVTHLPLHTLRAAAASAPAGEWGSRAQEDVIETIGWVRVRIPERLNKRMFVARVEGSSMDDGRSGLADGKYAVFELWPTGSRQGLIVLARGSFSDPETGTYALKKYVPEERSANRSRQHIRLVSLNPDKSRFPDIELTSDREDDVAIVAKLVRPLGAGDVARRPKSPTRPGRRDLSATADILDELEAFGNRFFDAPGRSVDPKEAAETWTSEFVCMDAESGGPHVEVGPLPGLWTFVKQLRVVGRDWTRHVLSSNARERRVRISAPVSAGPWQWQAVGFEDDTDVDLSRLTIPALEPNRPHVFKVDASGVGRMVQVTSVSRGQHYRLLIPNGCWSSIHHPPTSSTFDGWHLWEVEPGADAVEIAATLRDLGLSLGEQDIKLEWVLVPPVLWKYTIKGAAYAVFSDASSAVLSIAGPAIDADGAARCYVCGPQSSETLAFKAGSRWVVQFTGLAPGRYAVVVLYDRTRIAPAHEGFEVVSELPRTGRAECVAVVGSQSYTLQPDTPTRLGCDDVSAALTNSDDIQALGAHAPPGWPVRVLWSELSQELLCTLNADEDGVVDSARLTSVALSRTRIRTVGDLIVDSGELGLLVWPHQRRRTPDSVRSAIGEIVRSRREVAERLVGNYELLLPRWFEPICSELGYEVADAPEVPEPLPGHFRVCKLRRVIRRKDRISISERRLLVLAEAIEDTESTIRQWLDDLCITYDLPEVVFSDGIRWALHRVDARVPLKLWTIEAVIEDESLFLDFLRHFAEGV